MNAIGRLIAFAVVLVAIFAASFGAGATFGPSVADDTPAEHEHTTEIDE